MLAPRVEVDFRNLGGMVPEAARVRGSVDCPEASEPALGDPTGGVSTSNLELDLIMLAVEENWSSLDPDIPEASLPMLICDEVFGKESFQARARYNGSASGGGGTSPVNNCRAVNFSP